MLDGIKPSSHARGLLDPNRVAYGPSMGSETTSVTGRLAGMAHAMRDLAATRDPARLRPQAAISARVATAGRAGLLVLRHAPIGPSLFADGLDPLPATADVIAAI